jgi:hypothetical protein
MDVSPNFRTLNELDFVAYFLGMVTYHNVNAAPAEAACAGVAPHKDAWVYRNPYRRSGTASDRARICHSTGATNTAPLIRAE